MTLPLAVELAELRGPLERAYRNTVYCSTKLLQVDGTIHGTYCSNRWCLVCTRVQTARAINRYEPVLAGWTDLRFVTLTIPNVGPDQLARSIDQMIKAFVRVKGSMKKAGIPLKALRKLECTYNHKRADYHPHFHVAVEGRQAADELVNRWLEQWPTANRGAQDHRAGNLEALVELFKYFTKLIAKNGKASAFMPTPALDVIFQSMRGRRVYQSCGFTLPPVEVDEEGEVGKDGHTEAISRLEELVLWQWDQAASDWVDRSTGEMLTGYEPKEGIRAIATSSPLDEQDHPRTRQRLRLVAA